MDLIETVTQWRHTDGARHISLARFDSQPEKFAAWFTAALANIATATHVSLAQFGEAEVVRLLVGDLEVSAPPVLFAGGAGEQSVESMSRLLEKFTSNRFASTAVAHFRTRVQNAGRVLPSAGAFQRYVGLAMATRRACIESQQAPDEFDRPYAAFVFEVLNAQARMLMPDLPSGADTQSFVWPEGHDLEANTQRILHFRLDFACHSEVHLPALLQSLRRTFPSPVDADRVEVTRLIDAATFAAATPPTGTAH